MIMVLAIFQSFTIIPDGLQFSFSLPYNLKPQFSAQAKIGTQKKKRKKREKKSY